MKTQQDNRTRIVAFENLRAMCARVSGMAHTYEITKVSRSRVHVTYSNPDEYGSPNPVTAVFPAIPSTWPGDEDNPRVIIGEMIRTIGGNDRDYDYQAFEDIVSGLPVYRDRGEAGTWKTRHDIDGTDRYICPDGKVRMVDLTHPYTNDTFAAFDVTAETSPETFARIGGTRHFAYFTWSDLRPVKE